MKYLIYILFGIIGGVIGGMGMGGGTLLIPLLTLCLNMPQLQAQTINLISFVLMAVVSLVIHIKNKLVVYKSLLKVLPISLAFCILTSFFAVQVKDDILRKIFGVFLLVIGVLFMLQFVKNALFKVCLVHKKVNFATKFKFWLKWRRKNYQS